MEDTFMATASPAYEQLELFPKAKHLPPHSERQRLALKSSIGKQGQVVPTVIWEHEGTRYILDGATSLAICRELLSERATTVAEFGEDDILDAQGNSVDLEPKFDIFRGTPEEALEFFIARNFHRRTLTQSQTAMFVAMAGFIPEMGEGPQDGRYVAIRDAATKFAVSRTMIYSAGTVLNNDLELAAQVLEGSMSVNYACSIIRSRIWQSRASELEPSPAPDPQRRFHDSEDEEDEADDFDEDDAAFDEASESEEDENYEDTTQASVDSPAGPVVSPLGRNRARITSNGVFDGEGVRVAPEQTIFIESLAACDQLERSFRTQLQMLDTLTLPSLTEALRQSMRRDILNRIQLLVGVRPFAVCPSCKGASFDDAKAEPKRRLRTSDEGLEDDQESKEGRCQLCDAYGYLTATQRKHSASA